MRLVAWCKDSLDDLHSFPPSGRVVCNHTRAREHTSEVLLRTLTAGRGEHIRKRGVAAGVIGAAAIAAAVGGMSRRFAIVDDSMRPTFEPDDWVIARRHFGVPTRGEVVIFTHSSHPDRFLVKRIIGLPCERVTARDGQICINDRALADPWGDGPMCADSDHSVPAGAVWVLGDNRCSPSVDSRVFGAVPIEDVRWKVVARYWPPSRAGRIDSSF